MFGLTLLDLLVLVTYFVLMIAIGFGSARLVKNREDFYMGGRRFGKFLTAFFSFGAGTHADHAVGVASKSYSVGLSGIWYQWVMLFTLPIYWLLAVIFRRARVLTTADFFELRYGSQFMVLYSFFGMSVCVILGGVMLFGTARLIEALTNGGIPLATAILLMAVASLLYGSLGGLIAAVWNDLFQGILTIVMSLLLIPFFWLKIGGLGGLQASMPNREAVFRLVMDNDITVFWIFMMSINSLMSMVVQPHTMSNAGSARTEMDSRVGFVSGMVLKRLMTVPWALTGVMAVALYGQGTIQGDHAFGTMARDLLPAGFAGLMIACVMASVMDNVCVFMLCFSGLWTNNIFKRFLVPTSDERTLLRISRIASAAFGVCSVALSFSFGDAPSALRFTWQTVPLMGISFFLGLYWRRANRYGAFASFLTALIAMLLSNGLFRWSGDAGLPLTISFFLGTGLVAGVVVSYLTPSESEEKLDRFFLTINTPIGQEHILQEFELEVASRDASVERGQVLSQTIVAERTKVATRTKLLPFQNWEIPVPSRQAWVGFLVCLGLVLLMLSGLRLLAEWLAHG